MVALLFFCFRSCDSSAAEKVLSHTPLHYPLSTLLIYSCTLVNTRLGIFYLAFGECDTTRHHCSRRHCLVIISPCSPDPNIHPATPPHPWGGGSPGYPLHFDSHPQGRVGASTLDGRVAHNRAHQHLLRHARRRPLKAGRQEDIPDLVVRGSPRLHDLRLPRILTRTVRHTNRAVLAA